jgi:hypothetical protein
MLLLHVIAPGIARAQDWNVDARAIGMGGVSATDNLATGMVEQRRGYTTLFLPFGMLQIASEPIVYDPDNVDFDPIRLVESLVSPFHFVAGRPSSNSAAARLVFDLRSGALNRDLTTYRGFNPANALLAEGLFAPRFGRTFKIQQTDRGVFHGAFVGAGPYLSLHAAGSIDLALTNVLSTGVNVPNARLPISTRDQGQVGLAAIGGYRGHYPWPNRFGMGRPRDGLYVAADYKFLGGFLYEDDALAIQLNTDAAGLVTLGSNASLDHLHATGGTGFAIDVGAQAVFDRWEAGFGADGLANRITWSGVEHTTYSLASVLAGGGFTRSITTPVPDARVTLPVDYKGQVKYEADRWSAVVGGGHGFGGATMHGGVEWRRKPLEFRGGSRYSYGTWNPSGGVGYDFTPKVALDVAAFGTTANIERARRLAVAASIRFNYSY